MAVLRGPFLQAAQHGHMAEAQAAELWLLGFIFLGIPCCYEVGPREGVGGRGEMIHIVALKCGKEGCISERRGSGNLCLDLDLDHGAEHPL